MPSFFRRAVLYIAKQQIVAYGNFLCIPFSLLYFGRHEVGISSCVSTFHAGFSSAFDKCVRQASTQTYILSVCLWFLRTRLSFSVNSVTRTCFVRDMPHVGVHPPRRWAKETLGFIGPRWRQRCKERRWWWRSSSHWSPAAARCGASVSESLVFSVDQLQIVECVLYGYYRLNTIIKWKEIERRQPTSFTDLELSE